MTIAQIRASAKVRDDIRDFLLGAESLPAPQGVALRLQTLAEDPTSSMNEISRLIEADPGLSGFVMRSANSALYRSGRPLFNVKQAVMRLGVNIVRMHALALSLSKLRITQACSTFDYSAFWAHSLLCAELMAVQAASNDRLPGDESFALGLLGGIGRLVFATAVPERYAEVLNSYASGRNFLDVLEREAFGFDHYELSAVVMMEWQLPTVMAEMVYWQRAPEEGGFPVTSRAYVLCGALQLAAQLASVCISREMPDADALSAVYLRGALLGYSPAEVKALARQGLARLPEWMSLAGLPADFPLSSPERWPA